MNVPQISKEYEARMIANTEACLAGTGDPRDCDAVGEYYGVVVGNYKQAAQIYKRNCVEKLFGHSCFKIGRYLTSGNGVEINDQEAFRMLEIGCLKGKDVSSCYNYGHMALSGLLNTEGKMVDGIQILESNCLNRRDLASCCEAAEILLRDGENLNKKRREYNRDIERLVNANLNPSSPSASTVANPLVGNRDLLHKQQDASVTELRKVKNMERVDKISDPDERMKHTLKAIQANSLPQVTKSELLLVQDQVRELQNRTNQLPDPTTSDPDLPRSHNRDPVRSLPLLSLACDLGHVRSCYNLAVMYKRGDGLVSMDKDLHTVYKDKYLKLTQDLVKKSGKSSLLEHGLVSDSNRRTNDNK